jgi:hypothetical protein
LNLFTIQNDLPFIYFYPVTGSFNIKEISEEIKLLRKKRRFTIFDELRRALSIIEKLDPSKFIANYLLFKNDVPQKIYNRESPILN